MDLHLKIFTFALMMILPLIQIIHIQDKFSTLLIIKQMYIQAQQQSMLKVTPLQLKHSLTALLAYQQQTMTMSSSIMITMVAQVFLELQLAIQFIATIYMLQLPKLQPKNSTSNYSL